jgi:sugar/nucleoside kinase (ribokinase family)
VSGVDPAEAGRAISIIGQIGLEEHFTLDPPGGRLRDDSPKSLAGTVLARSRSCGGCAHFAAVTAQWLGHRPDVLANLGEDRDGDAVRRLVAGHGYDVRDMRHGRSDYFLTLWIGPARSKALFCRPGDGLTVQDVRNAASATAADRTILFPCGDPAVFELAVDVLRPHCTQLVACPNQLIASSPRLVGTVLDGADVLFLNTPEAEACTGADGFRRALDWFRNRARKADVCITRGAQGAVLLRADGEFFSVRAPARREQLATALGAGDMLATAFTCFSWQYDPPEALRRAVGAVDDMLRSAPWVTPG